jgi:hypothetical protein
VIAAGSLVIQHLILSGPAFAGALENIARPKPATKSPVTNGIETFIEPLPLRQFLGRQFWGRQFL